MAQITSGIRGLLSTPKVYDIFQNLMGAKSLRENLMVNHIEPPSDSKLLDIGCGTGQLLQHLSDDIKYFGIDLSADYISFAKSQFGLRGEFYNSSLAELDSVNFPLMDRVVAFGVLHHLSDTEGELLFKEAKRCLKPGGKIVTIDPTFVAGQSRVAKFLISRDRGQNVRTPSEYSDLAKHHFSDVNIDVQHRSWIPYTHCIVECQF